LNAVDIAPWISDWAWSLPLIVLTVVIHVCGLALIGGKFVAVLGASLDARNFIPKFAAVIGGTVLLATVLHGIESAIWAAPIAFWALCRTTGSRCSIARRYDDLRPREPVSERSMAVDGRFGRTKRNAALWTDAGISVRHDPKGLAAR
jgi:hypothetical protein